MWEKRRRTSSVGLPHPLSQDGADGVGQHDFSREPCRLLIELNQPDIARFKAESDHLRSAVTTPAHRDMAAVLDLLNLDGTKEGHPEGCPDSLNRAWYTSSVKFMQKSVVDAEACRRSTEP